ncbi:small ribosomal subunit Rsm22 family protein [Aminobacter sp. AP02]|uniref:small ribosomal subunit Rsm22 family protein n=1 Tax=Aminobacter sp. AP02 TaxID=2135737 RepID=UPI000D6CCA67|nr:small ribosomal subunit Rsm22 family protein [Aminobacter sp. AP02]PWK76269.1 ribosomal protein RSM22 (predicted rRNA methylase) [Aminobacter sp. AP02]
MELPATLRAAVDRALEGVALAELQRAADILSSRYRAETRDGRLHLSDELFANAYLATRLPATFAAVRASLQSAAELMPYFEPKSLLDLGAGPGTALWAASDCWPTIASATMLEASQSIRKVGMELSDRSGVEHVEWRAADASKSFQAEKADLVTLAYVLDELSPAEGLALAERLWAATTGLLVIVEPGTPAGWRRMMAVRSRLVELGAHLAAPCPHSQACPIIEPDWCHFSRRVARSRLHRLTKRGDVPWEDEKYIFVAASRTPAEAFRSRVLAPARGGSGKIQLKLCQENGSIDEKLLTKRDGELFKTARRVDWGDIL